MPDETTKLGLSIRRIGERYVTLGYQAFCLAVDDDGGFCDEEGSAGGFDSDLRRVKAWAREHLRTPGRHRVFIERQQRRRV